MTSLNSLSSLRTWTSLWGALRIKLLILSVEQHKLDLLQGIIPRHQDLPVQPLRLPCRCGLHRPHHQLPGGPLRALFHIVLLIGFLLPLRIFVRDSPPFLQSNVLRELGWQASGPELQSWGRCRPRTPHRPSTSPIDFGWFSSVSPVPHQGSSHLRLPTSRPLASWRALTQSATHSPVRQRRRSTCSQQDLQSLRTTTKDGYCRRLRALAELCSSSFGNPGRTATRVGLFNSICTSGFAKTDRCLAGSANRRVVPSRFSCWTCCRGRRACGAVYACSGRGWRDRGPGIFNCARAHRWWSLPGCGARRCFRRLERRFDSLGCGGTSRHGPCFQYGQSCLVPDGRRFGGKSLGVDPRPRIRCAGGLLLSKRGRGCPRNSTCQHHQPYGQEISPKGTSSQRWWACRRIRRRTARDSEKGKTDCGFPGPDDGSARREPASNYGQVGGAVIKDWSSGGSDDKRNVKAICLETAIGRVSYSWLTSQLLFSCGTGEVNASTEKYCSSCELPSFHAELILRRCSAAGGGVPCGQQSERPCESHVGAEQGTDYTGESFDNFRPPPGLEQFQPEPIEQRLPRTTTSTTRAGSPSRNFLHFGTSSYGEKDAASQTGGVFSSGAHLERSHTNSLCGALRWVRSLSRPWMSDVADSHDLGSHAGRKLCGCSGCHGLDGGLPRTGSIGLREDGCGLAPLSQRGPAFWGLSEPGHHQLRKGESICTSGRAEMDHDRLGLHQRDGPHCGEETRCRGREARQRSSWGAATAAKSKESSKEGRKGRRKTEGREQPAGGGVRPPYADGIFSKSPHFSTSETSSVSKILAAMPRWILATRTTFGAILARTFHIQCRGKSSTTAVFPLPLMDFGLFEEGCPKLSRRRWQSLVRKRFIHVLIVALNYMEGGFGFQQLSLLGRSPNSLQRDAHRRLRALVTACDGPGASFTELPLVPGRSGPEFISRLKQLEHFAERCTLLNPRLYSTGPADLEKKTAGELGSEDKVSADIQPYTSLNADRLRLVGTGQWHAEKWLNDELYLPYVEPLILKHHCQVDFSNGPVLSREEPAEYLKLAYKWERLGLLSLTNKRPHDDSFTRIFNAFKNEECDRQIGDRRLANMTEFSIRGPSQFLPGGYLITGIHVPKGMCVYGSITDRKDFYHQCWGSRRRAESNVTPFPFSQDLFEGTSALEDLRDSMRIGRSRTAAGDNLGHKPRSLLATSDEVFPCFRSLLQGDHLGVEFALSAHGALLQDVGLLAEDSQIKGHSPFPEGPRYEGLVIDDFFVMAVGRCHLGPEENDSSRALAVATKQYEKHGVLGSTEKDVIGSRHFKVVGAEVDSSDRTQSLGLTTVGAPLAKRLAMMVLGIRIACLPVITAQVASRLARNFTSIFMFRRCLSCLINELYAFSTEDRPGNDCVYEMPRSCAEELVLASIFSLVATSDVSVKYCDKVYASDASMKMGAVVSRRAPEHVVKTLWLGGDKRGAFTKLDPPFRGLCRAVGIEPEPDGLDALPEPRPTRNPDFSFDFVEVCGGVGSVSAEMAKLGYTVMAPIELSDSPHFDVRDLKLIEWLCHMLKTKRLRALMVEPVCTTFSPAAHPAIRSYAQPAGFDRQDAKTIQGNVVAFRCIFLLWYASTCSCPALGEQPRLSKMAWLSAWRFLLRYKGFEEAVVASCQFGSPHRKEFRMLGWGIDMAALEKRCPGGHEHVQIAGKYTKPSAVYVPALAKHFAKHMARALRAQQQKAQDEPDVRGLESVICNDILVSGEWSLESQWYWRKPGHINILESHAYLKILRGAMLDGGDCRLVALLDSRVAKGSHAKGRSSALALRPTLRKGAAWQLASNTYPSLGFAPTRINTADAPSRDKPVEVTDSICLSDRLTLKELQKVHSVGLAKWAAAWTRLVILASLAYPGASLDPERSDEPLCEKCTGFWISAILVTFGLWTCISHLRASTLWTLTLYPSCSFLVRWIFPRSLLHLLLLCQLVYTSGYSTPRLLVTSHGMQPLPLAILVSSANAMVLTATGAEELSRARRRAEVNLVPDRTVSQVTRSRRQTLLDAFEGWLRNSAGLGLADIVDAKEADPEVAADWLVAYGRELFYAGKAYGRFAETLNAVASRRPLFKKQIVKAWDLAFAWVADEPHSHHPAMPASILLAFVTLALLWGWPRDAAILMMTWCGIMRVGEATSARRSDLVLPEDGAPGMTFALLQIRQPKTRGVGPKHQAARIDPADAIQLMSATFGNLSSDDFLWNRSSQALRKRFGLLQKALGLPTVRSAHVIPYSLASLRAGGATHLLHKFEDAELVRRRGRWLSSRVCEIYLQEINLATYTHKLSPQTKEKIERLLCAYNNVLERSCFFLRNFIPADAWPRMWWPAWVVQMIGKVGNN